MKKRTVLKKKLTLESRIVLLETFAINQRKTRAEFYQDRAASYAESCAIKRRMDDLLRIQSKIFRKFLAAIAALEAEKDEGDFTLTYLMRELENLRELDNKTGNK